MKFFGAFVLLLSLAMLSVVPGIGQTVPGPTGDVYLPIVIKPAATATPSPTPTQIPATFTPTLPPAPTSTPTRTPVPASEVAVLSSTAFIPFAGSGSEYIVGEVVNRTGSNVEFVKINAVLRNSAGAILDGDYSYSYVSTLAPGMISSFLIIFSDPPVYDHYELTVTWSEADKAPYEFQLSNLETYFDSDSAFHAKGVVANQSTDTHTFVKVFVTVYNEAGQVIGVEYGYLNPHTLAPGQSVPFDEEVYFWRGKPNESLIRDVSVKSYDD